MSKLNRFTLHCDLADLCKILVYVIQHTLFRFPYILNIRQPCVTLHEEGYTVRYPGYLPRPSVGC
jgi:hypothetical protein